MFAPSERLTAYYSAQQGGLANSPKQGCNLIKEHSVYLLMVSYLDRELNSL